MSTKKMHGTEIYNRINNILKQTKLLQAKSPNMTFTVKLPGLTCCLDLDCSAVKTYNKHDHVTKHWKNKSFVCLDLCTQYLSHLMANIFCAGWICRKHDILLLRKLHFCRFIAFNNPSVRINENRNKQLNYCLKIIVCYIFIFLSVFVLRNDT